jgi:hypothetical protein
MFVVLAGEGVFTTQKSASHTAADGVVVQGGFGRDELVPGSWFLVPGSWFLARVMVFLLENRVLLELSVSWRIMMSS